MHIGLRNSLLVIDGATWVLLAFGGLIVCM